MKLDIEGSEVEVIPDLIVSGALSQIDLVFLEWHQHKTKLNDTRLAFMNQVGIWLDEELIGGNLMMKNILVGINV